MCLFFKNGINGFKRLLNILVRIVHLSHIFFFLFENIHGKMSNIGWAVGITQYDLGLAHLAPTAVDGIVCKIGQNE